MLAEIDQLVVALARGGDALPRPLVGRRRGQAVDDIRLDDRAQEGDALPALAAQDAALGPPEQVLRMGVAFAVSGVAAARHGDPEAMRQFLRGEIAPGEADVAFVFEFVVDDRLAPLAPPVGGALDVPVLDADVIDPRLAMIEVHRLFAVVDRLEMPRRIVLLDDVEEAVPARDRLHVDQEVVFVGERPPDVAKSAEAGDEIAHVAIVLLGRHRAIAPAVVGVEDDDVGFDAHVPQRGDLGLEVTERDDVRPVEIEFAVVAALVDVVKRLVLVEDVVLRETPPCAAC